MKCCCRCKELKPLTRFSKNKSRRDGLESQCKTCKTLYHQGRTEEKSRYDAQRYQENRHERLKQRAQYYKKNREAILKQTSTVETREKINKRRRERTKMDPKFQFAKFCRHQTHRALKGQSKSCNSEKYLGCTREEGIRYIESLWLPGMSWENHGNLPGKWEIDHIEPLANFNPNDPTAIFWACHISNLQPLWLEDNRSKGSKIK